MRWPHLEVLVSAGAHRQTRPKSASASCAMAQDKTAPPSTYTQLDDGDPDEDVIWYSKRAVLIESWSEMWWRENVTLPLRNCGLVPYAGPTTYKLTKNELIITFRSWDRYTQCLLPKKAVLETSRHIDLDHIISVSTTATARPYVTYETVTIEMDMMKTSRPVRPPGLRPHTQGHIHPRRRTSHPEESVRCKIRTNRLRTSTSTQARARRWWRRSWRSREKMPCSTSRNRTSGRFRLCRQACRLARSRSSREVVLSAHIQWHVRRCMCARVDSLKYKQ